MITLAAPAVARQLYLKLGGFLYGPIEQDTNEVVYLEIDTADHFEEGDGMYGENLVWHTHWDGAFLYHPEYTRVLPPSPTSPSQLQVQCFAGRNGNATTLSVFGFASGPVYAYALLNNLHSHSGLIIEDGCITEVSAFAYPSKPNVLMSLQLNKYTQIQPGPGVYANVTYQRKYVSSYDKGGYWSGPRSLEEIREIILANDSTWETKTAIPTQYSLEYGPVPSLDAFKLFALGQLVKLAAQPVPDQGRVYGELAQEASAKFNATNVNVWEFLSDLRHPQELVPKLRNLRNLKTLASNYLAVDFGILPTISDVQSLIGAFQRHRHTDRNGFECCYASRLERWVGHHNVSCSIDRHLKLAIGRYDLSFDSLCQKLESAGVLPTLSNLWDLVPYSFVVDWLVDVGGFLDSVDARQRIARLPIKYVTMSRKITCDLQFTPDRQSPYSGQLQKVHYHRWVSDQCPTPPLSLQQTATDFDHWIESAALILQRRSK